MRVVFLSPFLRRALQGTPPLTTQQMCVYPSSVTPDASVSFLTVPHAGLHVEGVEMSKGRGVSCQFKIPTSPIKSQNKIQRVQSDIKDSPVLLRHVHNYHHLARDAQLFADVVGDGGGGGGGSGINVLRVLQIDLLIHVVIRRWRRSTAPTRRRALARLRRLLGCRLAAAVGRSPKRIRGEQIGGRLLPTLRGTECIVGIIGG